MVVMVLKATCLLFGYEETWENAKKYLLNDMKFLDKLIGIKYLYNLNYYYRIWCGLNP